MTTNLRALIHMSGLRLCTMAQWEIRRLFQLIRHEIFQVSPFLGSFLAPKCVALGYCDEMGNRDEHCPIRPHKDNVLERLGGEGEGGEGRRSGAEGPLIGAIRARRQTTPPSATGYRREPFEAVGISHDVYRQGEARPSSSSTSCRRSAGGPSSSPTTSATGLPGRHAGPGRRRERRAEHAGRQGEARRGLRDEHAAPLHLVAVRRAPPAPDEPDHRLAARARPRRGRPSGRPKVGVIGMCLTGGFALGMAIDPVVGVAVVEPAGAAVRDEGRSARSRARSRTRASRRPTTTGSSPPRRSRLLRPRLPLHDRRDRPGRARRAARPRPRAGLIFEPIDRRPSSTDATDKGPDRTPKVELHSNV